MILTDRMKSPSAPSTSPDSSWVVPVAVFPDDTPTLVLDYQFGGLGTGVFALHGVLDYQRQDGIRWYGVMTTTVVSNA